MVNVELLQRTLEHIKANPEEWNQGLWTHCFAGHAVRLGREGVTLHTVPGGCGGSCCMYLVQDSERLYDIERAATATLGLSVAQARDLFYSDNDLAELVRVVNEIIASSEVAA